MHFAPEQRYRVGHEDLRRMEALLGEQLLVKACRLQRDVEERGVPQGKRPPRDKEWIRGRIQVEWIVLECNFMQDCYDQQAEYNERRNIQLYTRRWTCSRGSLVGG